VQQIFPKKEVLDPELDPNYDFEKPRVLGHVAYHEDTNIQPPNAPDKELFPERWEFYDPNVNAIKEDIGKVTHFA